MYLFYSFIYLCQITPIYNSDVEASFGSQLSPDALQLRWPSLDSILDNFYSFDCMFLIVSLYSIFISTNLINIKYETKE